MRSTVLIVSTFLLSIGGFFTYRVFQPMPEMLKGSVGPPPQAVPLHAKEPKINNQIGRGERPWIRNIDRLGRVASKFRGDEYQPRGGGHVHVIEPRAEFFQYSGGHVQKIAIEGETGDMELEEPASSGSASFDKGSAGAPKRGRIKRGVKPVTIRLYPDITAPGAQKDHVSITLTTDNLKFDNETFEIFTDAIVDQDGKVIVPADQVPIHVTGDYEFDGKGLIVRWNDLEGRLEYLEVTHGEYLTIVHPSGTSFGGAEVKKTSAGGAAGASTQPAQPQPGDGGMVASATGAGSPLIGSAGAAVTPEPIAAPARARAPGHKADPVKPGKHGPPPPYKADFESNVRVTQGARGPEEKQMATADRMRVDFLLSQSKAATQPSPTGSAGSPRAATAPSSPSSSAMANAGTTGPETEANPAAAGKAPATEPSAVATTEPVAVAMTQPSTQPSDGTEPVNVYWIGKLVVQPNADLSPGALQPGQSIVHMIADAAPVHVTHEANDVICAQLDYFSPEGNASLFSSPAFPQVVVRQLAARGGARGQQADAENSTPDDAVITSKHIDYSGVDHVAVLTGASEAQVQLKADPSDPAGPSKPGMLDIRWQRLARIYLLNHQTPPGATPAGKSPQQQLAVDHAHFEGDVDVRHPQLALKSQLLDTNFASVTSPLPTGDSALASRLPGSDAEPPTTHPTAAPREQTILRHLVATDAVTCQMTDEGGKKQNVECHQLTMDTALSPVGKLYPKKIDFFGDAHADAHAFDPTQDIHAGQIALTFVPTAPTANSATTKPVVAVARAATGPSAALGTGRSTALGTGPSTALGTGPSTQPSTRPVQLETMTATDRVRVKTTEGGFASAERLYVQMIDGQAHARLTGKPGAVAGSPESLATVIDAKKNVVIGPTIVSDPKQNIATVDGPGSMHLIRQDKPTDKPRPIDVVFSKQAIMDSPDNIIDIVGPLSVVSPDPDGTLNRANGRHVHITLADKPPAVAPPGGTTRPATRPARSASPSTEPSTKPAGLADSTQNDLMKGKVVTGIVLENDAVVSSTLTDAAGAILRQSDLKAELIRYVLASTQPGAKGTFIVPVPGQMLVRDHRPPAPAVAAAPGKAPAAQADSGDPGSSRGATAFQWSKQLTYDEATNTAVFTGDVLIVHKDDDAKVEPARLRADKVVAVFEPRTNPAAKPVAAQPGAAPEPGSQLQLKSMTATGNVIVTRAASELDAPRMDYDPVTGWMVATGTVRQPATFIDATGVNSANAKQIDWNSQTWNVKLKDIISRTGRKPQ